MSQAVLDSPSTVEAAIEKIDQKALRGSFSLLKRQVLAKIFGFLANIILTRLLDPAQFGIFAMISCAVSCFSLFGDAGLAASLVREKHEPTEREEASIFTMQQLIILVPSLILATMAPAIVKHFHYTPDKCWLIWVMVLSGMSASLKVIPSIRLERKLEFRALSRVDLVQSIVYQSVAIALAVAKCGVWSFALASLIAQLVGVAIIYKLEPWRPKFAWDWEACKSKLKFGFSFQLASICSFAKESINPVFIGALCGANSVGLVAFAGTTSAYPVMLSSFAGRVYFPLFSRHQHDHEKLKNAVESVIRWNGLCIMGLTTVLIVIAPYMVEHVFGAKWMPALPLIYFFTLANPFIAISWPIFSYANALGRSDLPMKFSAYHMIATWLIAAPLILKFGFTGFAIAQPLLCVTNLWLFKEAKKLSSFDILIPTTPSLVATIAALAIAVPMRQLIGSLNLFSAIGVALLTGAIYLSVAIKLCPSIISEIKTTAGHLIGSKVTA